MAQIARPDSDVSNTGVWSAEPLFEKIDEVSASDADFVTRTPSFSALKEFEVGLSNVTDPASSTDHVIRVRGRQTSGATGTLTGKLYQGTTLIATLSVGLTASFATSNHVLSGAEADSITDYTDLRLRIGASFPASRIPEVSWAEFEVPDVAGGGQTISPELLDHTTTLLAPTAKLSASMGLIDHLLTVFAPALALRVEPPLIDHSMVVFSPTSIDDGSGGAGGGGSDKHYVRLRRRGRMRSLQKGGM